jgi:hypothetical protein
MRFVKVVEVRGGLQRLKDKGVYRSRRVLIGDEIALMGKKALTKMIGAVSEDVAKHVCQDHLQEFERMIQESRAAEADPPGKPQVAYDLINNVITHQSAEPVSFEVLLTAWELENTTSTHGAPSVGSGTTGRWAGGQAGGRNSLIRLTTRLNLCCSDSNKQGTQTRWFPSTRPGSAIPSWAIS